MASINGIKITGLKSFLEHEGMTAYQGNVSYKGKKLGWWSQDYSGGICDNFDFNERLLDTEVDKYKASDRVDDDKYRKYTSLETLLADLVNVMYEEKEYKKFLKRGFPYMAVVSDGYHCFYHAASANTLDMAKHMLEGLINESKDKCFKNEVPKVTWYTSLADFDIVV